MALTTAQLLQCAQDFCQDVFVGPGAVANFSTDQIQSAIAAIDTGMHTTLSNAVTAKGGAADATGCPLIVAMMVLVPVTVPAVKMAV